ncbi:MAG: Uma2 family endonuclease [Polyangiaceae bacterium]|nr:Uma2 family endonuclease [Polyangiaceae bacterium]
MALAARKLATSADLFAIPEDHRFHEVIGGELVQRASPTFEHGVVQAKLSASVASFHRRSTGGRPGGWWIVSEVEVELEAHEVYRPDLSGWRRDRVVERPSGTPIRIRPDWVCEILSPSKPKFDLGTKFDVYQRNGVPHYWIIDPMSERLRVHRWTSEGYLVVLNAHRGQRVRAEPFDAIEISVGELFGDDPDQDDAVPR